MTYSDILIFYSIYIYNKLWLTYKKEKRAKARGHHTSSGSSQWGFTNKNAAIRWGYSKDILVDSLQY